MKLPVATVQVGCVISPSTVGTDGAVGCVLIVTEAEDPEVQPFAEAVSVYVPAGAVTTPLTDMVTPIEGVIS